MDAFSDPQAVARYAEGPPRLVPGFAGLQRMAAILLAERTPGKAKVLVLGAGGGLEIRAFAEAQPDWWFEGIDPSAEMIELARATIGSVEERTRLVVGLIDDAQGEPYDAAACILTLHFIEREERLRTLREVYRRLKPGAPLVVAHFSIPHDADERDLWLRRYSAFAIASGVDRTQAENARSTIAARLPILAPAEDEQLLRTAGFSGVNLFYVGFAFRGWVAYA